MSDSLLPPSLRTGLAGEVSDPAEDTLETVAALMRVFAKDAMTISGRYTHGKGRREVTGGDMRVALMYCARMFFQNTPEEEMARLVDEEREAMREEGSEESEEEESGTESEEEYGDGSDLGKEEGDGELDEGDVRLARNVDAIAASWPHWQPDDPVSQLLKRAIDKTPV